jgi:hypothetical protein
MAQLRERTEIAFEQIDELYPYEDWLLPFVSVHEFQQTDVIRQLDATRIICLGDLVCYTVWPTM